MAGVKVGPLTDFVATLAEWVMSSPSSLVLQFSLGSALTPFAVRQLHCTSIRMSVCIGLWCTGAIS